MIDDPSQALLTGREAAAYAGVSPATVRGWVRHGHLARWTSDDVGRPLYLALHVLEAERATRRQRRGRRRAAA